MMMVNIKKIMSNHIELTTTYTLLESNQTLLVECVKLTYIGIYSLCLFALSLSVNTVCLWMLLKNRRFLTPINYVVLSLTVVNLFGTLTDIPLVTINAFNCK